MKRRTFIGATAAASVALLGCKSVMAQDKKQDIGFNLKNNINHSVCHWCYKDIPLEYFLKNLNELGVKAIDLMGPKEWSLLKKHNIHCAIGQWR